MRRLGRLRRLGLGRLIFGPPPVVPGVPAVFIEWTSDGNDTTPEFLITINNWQDGDELVTRIGTNPLLPDGMATANGGAVILAVGDTLELQAPSVVAGTHYFKVGIYRGGITYWSETLSFTITASPPSYIHRQISGSDDPQNIHSLMVNLGDEAPTRFVSVPVACQNPDDLPVVTAAGTTLNHIVTCGTPGVSGGMIALFGGLVPTGAGVQQVLVDWTTVAYEWKCLDVTTLYNLASTTPKLIVNNYNNNPEANGTVRVPVDAGDIVLFAATSASGVTQTWAGASTPAPDGQRAAITEFSGTRMYTADWMADAEGEIVISTPGTNANRLAVVYA